jgi:hypothetical protein
MVFGFSWLAGKVMNKFGHDISGKLLSRWRLLKTCQLISHVDACTHQLKIECACMHTTVNICVTGGSWIVISLSNCLIDAIYTSIPIEVK